MTATSPAAAAAAASDADPPATGTKSSPIMDTSAAVVSLTIPNASRDLRRQEYDTAVKTFTNTCRFVLKPACLSPLTLAVFGWRTTNYSDTLECSHCRAHWRIVLPLTLLSSSSTSQMQSLLVQYESQMASRHAKSCGFRREAEHYLQQQERRPNDASSNTGGADIVDEKQVLMISSYFPHQLAWVWDALEVSLAEREHPIPLFTKIMVAGDDSTDDDDAQRVPLPSELVSSKFEMNGCRGEALVTMIAKHLSMNRNQFLLTLFGWRNNTTNNNNEDLVCNLCRSVYRTNNVPKTTTTTTTAAVTRRGNDDDDEENDDNSSPNPKRRKQHHDSNNAYNTPLIISCHRHYCPHICGVVRANGTVRCKPTWETLLTRIIDDLTDNGDDDDDLENSVTTDILIGQDATATPKAGDKKTKHAIVSASDIRDLLLQGIAKKVDSCSAL